VFKVHNSEYDYTKFKEEENDYLFHGSNISNWYSILSNGLKAGNVKEGTLLNGAAYGNGIYLSNSPKYSINYSTKTIASYEANNTEKYIMGVYQVLKPYQTYKKATNIYVIPNSDEVILKYLFIIDNTRNIDKIIKYIQDKYNNETIKTEESSTLNLISKMQNGRLKKELNDIMNNDSSKTDLYISIHLNNPSNINVWDINYSIENIPTDNILYTQLLKKNIKDIRLQILIPKRYPFEPPFVRVVYPRFKFRTGHITLGGSICMEVLSNKGWMPAMNIHNLLLQIKLLIITGSAELDDTNWNKEYTLVEAKTAFNRMISSHGW
jgi:ubiquitin-protein ligase